MAVVETSNRDVYLMRRTSSPSQALNTIPRPLSFGLMAYMEEVCVFLLNEYKQTLRTSRFRLRMTFHITSR